MMSESRSARQRQERASSPQTTAPQQRQAAARARAGDEQP